MDHHRILQALSPFYNDPRMHYRPTHVIQGPGLGPIGHRVQRLADLPSSDRPWLGPLNLARNSLEKLPDPTVVVPPGQRPKAAARVG